MIENVFGIMSARFRVFRRPINLDHIKTKKVTLACYALHNFLMTRNKKTYAPSGTFDRYNDDGSITLGEWRQEISDANMYSIENGGTRYIPNDAKELREEYEQYFVHEGDLEWQYKNM